MYDILAQPAFLVLLPTMLALIPTYVLLVVCWVFSTDKANKLLVVARSVTGFTLRDYNCMKRWDYAVLARGKDVQRAVRKVVFHD